MADQVAHADSAPLQVPGETSRRRLVIFAVVAIALLMASVDQTIVATALPSIQRDLGAQVNWSSWTISAASMSLPAERLAALGAPLNTLRPSGKLLLSWQQLALSRRTDGTDLYGVMTLDMMAMATRLSPQKPLGSYRMRLDWQGRQAGLTLRTLGGAMLLDGSGNLHDGHVQFSGTAQAAAGQEEKLAVLLSLLGQPRRINGKNVIGLEFKS